MHPGLTNSRPGETGASNRASWERCRANAPQRPAAPTALPQYTHEVVSALPLSLRKLFRNSAYLACGGMTSTLCLFVRGIIVARTLGPGQYGVLGVVFATGGLLRAMLCFRTGEPLTKHLVASREEGDAERLRLLLASSLLADSITRLLTFLAVVAVSPWVAGVIVGDQALTHAFWIYGGAILFTGADSTWAAVTRDQQRYRTLAAVPAVARVVECAVVLALWVLGRLALETFLLTLLGAAAALWLTQVVMLDDLLHTQYGTGLTHLPFGRCWRQRSSLAGFWEFMKVGYVSNSLTTLLKNGDVLILGYFAPMATVGLYRLAKALTEVLVLFARYIGGALYQDLNEMVARGDFAGIRHGTWRLTKYVAPLVGTEVVVAVAVAPFALPLVYGHEFAGAWPLFAILLVGRTPGMALFWAGQLNLALGDFRFALAVVAILAVVFVPAMALAVSQWGAPGLAAVTAALWLTAATASLVRARVLLKRRIDPSPVQGA